MSLFELTDGSSSTWPLVGFVAAILLWLGADELKNGSQELKAQLGLAERRIQHGSPEELALQRRNAQQLEAARQQLLTRLASNESEQMTRAKLVYELRQKCNAVPTSCQIRLAELTSTSGVKREVDANGDPTLESLGIRRARAILSGSFQTDELMRLYRQFTEDTQAQWRLNSVVVKGNEYELDIERLVLAPEGAPR